MTKQITSPVLGQHVKYVSAKGHVQVALVIATAESLTVGTHFADQFPLDADQVNLIAYSPTGVQRIRRQVPSQASVADNTDFAQGGFYLPLDADYIAPPKEIKVPDDISSLAVDLDDIDSADDGFEDYEG